MIRARAPGWDMKGDASNQGSLKEVFWGSSKAEAVLEGPRGRGDRG